MSSGKEHAWKLYDAIFKDGDEVLVITGEDEVEWGTLTTTEQGVVLERKGRRPRQLAWLEVRFMAHDGFPVRQIMDKPGECYGVPKDKAIREAFAMEFVRKPAHAAAKPSFPIASRRAPLRARFRDPFELEAEAVLHNPGNTGPAFWDHAYQECLTLRALDGAQAMLWDLETIYEMEVMK